MKQILKPVFGLATAALFGGIIAACGSGDISTATSDDDARLFLMTGDSANGYAGDIDLALEACRLDASCAQKMNGTVVVSSAAESSSSTEIVEPGTTSSSSAIAVSSSSTGTINLSSSSVIASSSSVTVILSSSSVAEGTVTGTCAPSPATISKGESTTWTFSVNAAGGVAAVTRSTTVAYDWTLTGSTEGSASGTGLKTTTAIYAESGSYGASLYVDGNTIECSPLQVNGATITGCTCTADATTVDVASGSATATWTVSGCTTNATITGYTWTGATGTSETATASLTTKGESVTPTVAVANDDNTVETFTCDAVKAVDSSAPDYEIAAANDKVSLPSGTSSVTMGGTNVAGCQFSCNATGDIIVELSTGDSFTGSYYVGGSVSTEACSGTLTVTLSVAAECSANWWY